MSKYLGDLIKSLQTEAKEHEAALQQHAMTTTQRFRRDNGHLNRLLQRIKSLQELQLSEAKRHRKLSRNAGERRIAA
jgi:hypothetical protein